MQKTGGPRGERGVLPAKRGQGPRVLHERRVSESASCGLVPWPFLTDPRGRESSQTRNVGSRDLGHIGPSLCGCGDLLRCLGASILGWDAHTQQTMAPNK